MAREKRAVEVVRAFLIEKHGLAVADELVPIKKGGCQLPKLRSLMHDTCNCANAVPRLLQIMKDESGVKYYTDEVWNGFPLKFRRMFDFLCSIKSYAWCACRCVQSPF